MNDPVRTFDARILVPRELSGDVVARVIEAASDIALLIDANGVIRDLYVSRDELLEESRDWLGQPWVETVTGDTKSKVADMLAVARADGSSRRREVNHMLPDGGELPVAYSTVRLDASGRSVAIGRDLRSISALQERLVEAQQAMERDYWRMRHLETRYRLLFQLTSEAVLVVDATTHRVLDANPTAGRVLGSAPKSLIGRSFAADVEPTSREAVERHLALVRSQGRAEPVQVRFGTDAAAWMLSASLMRHDAGSIFLMRLLPAEPQAGGPAATGGSRALDALHRSPDGFALVDFDGRVLAANLAFLDLVELGSEEQLRGESVGRWLGRPGADLPLLLATVREHGVVRLFSTSARGEYGSTTEVELSAVAVDGAAPCIGITMRDVGRRLSFAPRGAQDLTRAVEHLTGLLGKTSLKELIRDTTDLVERHFIEAALDLTDGKRTTAAEILGVSRQSLYVKLRKYYGDVGDRDDGGTTPA